MVCGARMAQRFNAQRCNGAGLSAPIHTRMHGGIDRETLGHCSIASLLLFTK